MERNSVSLSTATRFLDTRFGGKATDISLIGQGEWSQAYSFQAFGDLLVIRFGPWQVDFRKDELAAKWSSPQLPLPKVIEIGEGLGRYYAISERAFGKPLDSLDAIEAQQTLPSLFRMLDAIRLTDISASTGYGTWGADGNAPSTSWREFLLDIANDRATSRWHGWRQRLANWPLGNRLFEEGFEHLTRLVAVCPESRYLVHADLLSNNLLVANDQISAALDWGQAMYGDFLYDLAWFVFWSPWSPGLIGIDWEREALARYAALGLAIPSFKERLRCCLVHIGLDSLGYSVFKERWEFAEEVGERAIAFASAD